MKRKTRAAAVLFLTALLSCSITAFAEDIPASESAGPAQDEPVPPVEEEVSLDVSILGEYSFWDGKGDMPQGSYTNQYFDFQYTTRNGFNEKETIDHLFRMNNLGPESGESIDKTYSSMLQKLKDGEAVCLMYAESYAAPDKGPEDKDNFPKINISISKNDSLLTAPDFEKIVKNLEDDMKDELAGRYDISPDLVTLGYEASDPDPFTGMEHFAMDIQVKASEDVTYYSHQIYLFGPSEPESGDSFLCCITITSKEHEDISSILENNFHTPASGETEQTEETEETLTPEPQETEVPEEPSPAVPENPEQSQISGGQGPDSDFISTSVSGT